MSIELATELPPTVVVGVLGGPPQRGQLRPLDQLRLRQLQGGRVLSGFSSG